MGPKEKPRASSRAHIWLDITRLDSLLNRRCATSGTLRDANNQYNNPFWSVQRSPLEPSKAPTRRPLNPATLALLIVGHNDPRDSLIQSCRQITLRSKRYNASISMRVIMDSGGYLCMTNLTIKRRRSERLQGDHNVQLCKPYSHVDLKYPHPQWQLWRT